MLGFWTCCFKLVIQLLGRPYRKLAVTKALKHISCFDQWRQYVVQYVRDILEICRWYVAFQMWLTWFYAPKCSKAQKLHGSECTWCSFILAAPWFLLNGSSVAENVSWSTQTVKLQHPVTQGGRQDLNTSLISLPFSPSHHYPPMDTHMAHTVRHIHTTHTVLFNWDVIKLTWEDFEQHKLYTHGWNPLAKVVKCPKAPPTGSQNQITRGYGV